MPETIDRLESSQALPSSLLASNAGPPPRRKPARQRILWRIARYLKPYWRQGAALVLVLIIGAIAELLVPLIIQQITDNALIRGGGFPLVIRLVAALCGVRVLLWIAEVARGWLNSWMGGRITADIRAEVLHRLEHLPLRFYDSTQVGVLMSRIVKDAASVEEFLANGLPLLVVNAFTLAGILAFLFYTSQVVALCICLPIPAISLVAIFVWRRLRPIFRHQTTTWARLSAHLNESLSGIRIVKAFSQELREIAIFNANNRAVLHAATTAERGSFSFFAVVYVLMNLGMLLVWYVGGRQVLLRQLSLGQLLAAVSYLWMLYWPLQWFGQIGSSMNQALAGAERIFQLLDTPPEPYGQACKPLPCLRGRVRFRKVTFAYQPARPVLQNIDFEIAPGEMIGLVGKSGVGKTTIMNLLARFYEVDSGAIEVDGRDIREIAIEDLRGQIGIVPQDAFLFGGTIAENIAYGRPGVSFAEIVAAARIANAHSFIVAKPDGYDTDVGERGSRLSGGERQRLAIARAVVRDPRILILDEATSSLDLQAEKVIQEAIRDVAHGRTTFVIAHRLSTVRDASRLIVLEEGRIVEMGTHAELMARRGHFHSMVEAQRFVAHA